MSKKILFTALAGVAAVGLSSTALAQNYNNPNPTFYVGVQAGYGDTHWSDVDFERAIVGDNVFFGHVKGSFKGTGFAGRLFAGLDFNQYLAVETGFAYFPRTTLDLTGEETIDTVNGIQTVKIAESDKFNTYGVDLLGKISVPLADNVGLYAKVGPGYLHTGSIGEGDDDTNNIDLVYGFGADYKITPNLVADVSFTRYNGNHDTNAKDYQPDADLYALGLAYKFNI